MYQKGISYLQKKRNSIFIEHAQNYTWKDHLSFSFQKETPYFRKKNFISSNNTENIRLQFKLFERNIFSENVQNGIMVFDTVH